MAGNLEQATYQTKRLALDALGVTVRVWRKEHEPRFEIKGSIQFQGNIVSISSGRCTA